MPTTVYVVDPDPDERAWIASTLAPSVDDLAFLDDGRTLLASVPNAAGSCLLTSADADEAATLKLVRELRNSGATLPVIVLGPHSAFRTAVEIAQLEATDFLERPVSMRQLRAAIRRACTDVK